MRKVMEQSTTTDQNPSKFQKAEEELVSSDPDLCLLSNRIAALQLQEQQLNATCGSLLRQNDSLDQAIDALAIELAQELDLLKQVEVSQTLDSRPVEVLAVQIYSDKRKQQELTHQEEALKQQFLSTSTSNTKAELQIYELDDLVCKKTAELKDVKTQALKCASAAQLRTILCKSCVHLLNSEQKQEHLLTDLSSIATTPIRRQSSSGAKFGYEAYSL